MTEAKEWDVFISHASEDKAEVALPIATALKAAGVSVWLDSRELRLGNSLSRKIDEGLAKSRYGVVILSQAFFAKNWPQRELSGLVARQGISGEDLILPVWHEVDEKYIAEYSPPLADRMAVRTSEGTEEVVRQILGIVRPERVATDSGTLPEAPTISRDVASRPRNGTTRQSVEGARGSGSAGSGTQIERGMTAWRLLQVALGRASDLLSPVQSRPDFGFQLRDDENARRYLPTLGLSEEQITKVLSSQDVAYRSRTFAEIVDRRRLQQVYEDLRAFQNFVIENEPLLPDSAFASLIDTGKALGLALAGFRLALQEPHAFGLETERNQAFMKVIEILNVRTKELKRDIRSSLGLVGLDDRPVG